jgi:hypothetical protein
MVAISLFNSTVIRLSSWICHHHGCRYSLQFYNDLSGWMGRYHGCHSSLQFYIDAFVKLDVSLPILFNFTMICQPGWVVIMGAALLFNSTSMRLSGWMCRCHCSVQFYNDLSAWMGRHHSCHSSLQFHIDAFVKLDASLPLFSSILQ